MQGDTKQKPINYSSVNEFLSNVRNKRVNERERGHVVCLLWWCKSASHAGVRGFYASLSLQCLCCVVDLDLRLFSSAVLHQCDPGAIAASVSKDLVGGLEHSLSNSSCRWVSNSAQIDFSFILKTCGAMLEVGGKSLISEQISYQRSCWAAETRWFSFKKIQLHFR